MVDPVEFAELKKYVEELNTKLASMQHQLLECSKNHLQTEEAITMMSHRTLSLGNSTSAIDSGDTAWVITGIIT